MLSANQIAGFLNQLFLQNKSIKQAYFFHVDINSQKLKVDCNFFVGHDQKWVWPIWSLDSKIDCISSMNAWIN